MPVELKLLILLWLQLSPWGLVLLGALIIAAGAGWHGWVGACARMREEDQRRRAAYQRQRQREARWRRWSLDGVDKESENQPESKP